MKDFLNKSINANYIEGMQTLTGKLTFMSNGIVFKANSVNGVMNMPLISYDDIISVELKNTLGILPNAIVIKTKQKKDYCFVVSNRKDIAAFLNSRIIKEGE